MSARFTATPIDDRPEHYAEMRDGEMVCANCGNSWAEMRADVHCRNAPRTAHGVDPWLMRRDAVYHKLVVQGRVMRAFYRAGQAGPRQRQMSEAEFRSLYMNWDWS